MALKYHKNEAKEYARTALKGVWTALPYHFTADDKIDEKAVEEALERAQKSLADLKPGEHQEEVAAVMAIIQRSTAQLHIKRKRKTV